jgi:hypothetical protein
MMILRDEKYYIEYVSIRVCNMMMKKWVFIFDLIEVIR